MRKVYLMTPGPTPIPPEVLLTQAEPMVHHRTPQYTAIFVDVVEGLKRIFLTGNDVITLAASGTGGMEAAVANCFSPGERVLVCAGGKFGERFGEICKAYSIQAEFYQYDWDRAADPAEIKKRLAADPGIKGVFLTHSETSTGVVNDVQAVGKVVAETPAILVVDSISGAGALEMRTDDWLVDVLVAGSQKALMTPPGLAAVAVSPKAWELIEQSTSPRYYFDLMRARKKYADKSPQTPFTPAISLVKGMLAAIKLIEAEGLERVWERHRRMALSTRAAVRAMGLELYARDLERAYAVTAVKAPAGIDGAEIVRVLNRKHGVIVAGGQGDLKGKIFRIGHVGYYDIHDLLVAIGALEMTLAELGHTFERGTGVAALERTYMEFG